MKAMTFVSMMLLAMSGVAAHPVVTAEPVAAAGSMSLQANNADLTTHRICMRCPVG